MFVAMAARTLWLSGLFGALARRLATKAGTAAAVPGRGKRASWDSYQYAMAVQRLLTQDKVTDALQLLQEGRKRKLDVCAGYNTVLSYYGLRKRSNQAISLFNSMKKMNVAVTSRSYSALIRALARGNKVGKFELASKYFEEMRDRAFDVNEFTYTNMLWIAALEGQVGSAFKLFDEALDDGIQPTAYMYDLLIRACLRIGDGRGALQMESVAKAAGLDHFSDRTRAQLDSARSSAG